MKSNELQSKYRSLQGVYKHIFIIFTAISIVVSVNQLFRLNIFGLVLVENTYFYLTIALLLSLTFLLIPGRSSPKEHNKVPWYDVVLFLLTVFLSLYFVSQGMNIVLQAWEFNAPPISTYLALVMFILVLEALRRAGGTILFGVTLLFSLYPLVADTMPAWISGLGYGFFDTVKYHVFSTQSILGLPLRVLANTIIGFIIFGVALQFAGGGKFFIDFAMSLMGRKRGGSAKVAILSSGFFGSLSGSVISNVITTGSMTIPTMKRSGYDSKVAGAIEACSSTGGVLMPPVMGATAFIMASFLGVPYMNVVIAAIIPAVLYYYSLLIQADCYAAKHNLMGAVEGIPHFIETVKKGWFYFFVIFLLVYFLAIMQNETWAPFFATVLLLLLGLLYKRMIGNAADFLMNCGKVLVELVAIVAGIGLIIGSLSMTGMAQALSTELVLLAGENIYALLLVGAITSFILGVGMTVTACYVFLAVILVPALTQLGLNEMGVHLFVFYWGMLSYITPPVALGVYAASSIADSDPMQTGLEAMKIGLAIYFLPFFFVLSPTLILQTGSFSECLIDIGLAVIGLTAVAAGTQGYLYFVGKIKTGLMGGWARVFLCLGGIALAIPETITDLLGMLSLIVGIVVAVLCNKGFSYSQGLR